MSLIRDIRHKTFVKRYVSNYVLADALTLVDTHTVSSMNRVELLEQNLLFERFNLVCI
jgi:hypothetical protein